MSEYYKADSRWKHYINNKEQYADELIIKGHFHGKVPEDIINSYETVEYLMAHAYYHWPMYDEAFHKVLLTIEMGIKLKAKQLDIPLFIRKKNGDRWDRRLSDLIDDICNKDHLSDLKSRLDRSRGLRNMDVHPKQHSFSGPSAGKFRNIKYCINVLNRLFRDKDWHKNQQEELAHTKEMITGFDNQLLAIERDGKGELMSSILDFDTIEDVLFLVCLPVLDVKNLEADKNIYPDPVSYTFKNYTISKDQVTGKTLKGSKIKLLVTDRKDLHEASKKHQQYIKGIPKEKLRGYSQIIAQEAPWLLSNAEYEYNKYYLSEEGK